MNDAQLYPCATCKYQGANLIVAIFMGQGSQSCYRPGKKVDPVTGEPEDTFCDLERAADFRCGPNGKYHSKRETMKK